MLLDIACIFPQHQTAVSSLDPFISQPTAIEEAIKVCLQLKPAVCFLDEKKISKKSVINSLTHLLAHSVETTKRIEQVGCLLPFLLSNDDKLCALKLPI